MPDLTHLLAAIHRGEPAAAGALLAQVYDELRQLARAKMAREQPGHTLQPTALVHEAWLRLGCGEEAGEQRFENRAHFFGAAAEAMRRILVESARRGMATKVTASTQPARAANRLSQSTRRRCRKLRPRQTRAALPSP